MALRAPVVSPFPQIFPRGNRQAGPVKTQKEKKNRENMKNTCIDFSSEDETYRSSRQLKKKEHAQKNGLCVCVCAQVGEKFRDQLLLSLSVTFRLELHVCRYFSVRTWPRSSD